MPIFETPDFLKNSKWVCSGNTTITNRRQPCGTARKSRSTITRHQEQIKQSNQVSLPHQDDCNTRMDIKLHTTKHKTITYFHNGSNNKQKYSSIAIILMGKRDLVALLNLSSWWGVFNIASARSAIECFLPERKGSPRCLQALAIQVDRCIARKSKMATKTIPKQ